MLFVELLSFNQLNTLRHSEPEPEMLSAELGSINWLICNNLRHLELEPKCRV